MNIHEMRDELPIQQLTNRPFFFKGNIDLDGKFA